MTVSYQYEVASSTSGGFTKLLFMWRGSLYKLIYRELLLFLIIFGALSATYRHVLTVSQRKEFEKVVIYCDKMVNLIPLSFVLGFYVSYIAERWWKQYTAIPWPDKVMHVIALYVTGNDEHGRMLRRNLMRYLNLSLILVLRSISSAVKRRFPTLDHVVDSGFMTSLELELFQSVPSVEFNTYWIPCTWFVNLLKEAQRSRRLQDVQGLKIIMEEFNDFRSKCGLLWSYDWVSIPLVYTQVVTLATYTFFGVALIGRQYIEGGQKDFQLTIDIYVPVFTILQFFFFMGLLKVAEQLINPFGDDDEDFELNWLIDRHTKVSYLGVDTLMNRCPPLVKDIYYDAEDLILPYTEAAAGYKRKTYRGSVANMSVPQEKQSMFLPDIEEEEQTKDTPTPRTSSVSLSNLNLNRESPVNGKRQISGDLGATNSRMVEKSSESIIQMNALDMDSPNSESKGGIADAMKRFSSRCTTPRIDLNRKPFYSATLKSNNVMLEPWPSATNLSQLDEDNDTSSRKSSWEVSYVPPEVRVSCPDDSEESSLQEFQTDHGIVNSAFSQERLHVIEDNFKNYQEIPSKDNNDLQQTTIDESKGQRSNTSQHPVRRSRTVNTFPRKKKSVRWRPSGFRFRRRTTDDMPSIEKLVIPPNKSSPNLIEPVPSTSAELRESDNLDFKDTSDDLVEKL